MRPQRFANLLALAALLGAAGPARADWLVTREGAQLETKGAWTVKGKLVVFHTVAGKLSSLRVAEVDLDASRRVTEEAVAAQAQAAAEPEKPVERKKSIRIITDKDVQESVPPPPAEEPAETAPAAGPAPGAASGPGVVVEGWKQGRDPEDDHVLIEGTLHNASSATAATLKLKVLIFDEAGSLMATSQAAVATAGLAPGQKTTFRADFPGYYSFATIKFEPLSRRLTTRSADEPIPPAPPE